MTKGTAITRRQRETGIETERGTESGSGTETGRMDGTEIGIEIETGTETGTVTDGCGEKTLHRIANQREVIYALSVS